MRSILVTGVSGVGKTTLGRQLASLTGIAVIEYADLMLDVLDGRDRAEIRRLSFAERQPIYAAVERRLREGLRRFSPDELVLLVVHLTVMLRGQINPFPLTHYEAYRPAGVILVEATPAAVRARRLADKSRAREDETEAQIRQQQIENRRIAAEIKRSLGADTVCVQNNESTLCALHLVPWTRSVSGGIESVASNSKDCRPV